MEQPEQQACIIIRGTIWMTSKHPVCKTLILEVFGGQRAKFWFGELVMLWMHYPLREAMLVHAVCIHDLDSQCVSNNSANVSVNPIKHFQCDTTDMQFIWDINTVQLNLRSGTSLGLMLPNLHYDQCGTYSVKISYTTGLYPCFYFWSDDSAWINTSTDMAYYFYSLFLQ